MLDGFVFYYNFVSADSCGFARRGGTRSSEDRFPSSRSSPLATGGRAVARVAGKAPAEGRLRCIFSLLCGLATLHILAFFAVWLRCILLFFADRLRCILLFFADRLRCILLFFADRLSQTAASDALSPKANSSSVCLRRLTFNMT